MFNSYEYIEDCEELEAELQSTTFNGNDSTQHSKRLFIYALYTSSRGNVLKACRTSGVSTSIVYHWAQIDSTFKRYFDDRKLHFYYEAERVLLDCLTDSKHKLKVAKYILEAYKDKF
jgi:hypothetical protein